VTVVVCIRPPLVPVIVSGNVPGAVFDLVEMVSVEVDVAGFGLNEAVVRLGRPLTLRLTEPLKPLIGEMVTV
jgi:hypothetical protein